MWLLETQLPWEKTDGSSHRGCSVGVSLLVCSTELLSLISPEPEVPSGIRKVNKGTFFPFKWEERGDVCM